MPHNHKVDDFSNLENRLPTSQNCHQHKTSRTSVTNTSVTYRGSVSRIDNQFERSQTHKELSMVFYLNLILHMISSFLFYQVRIFFFDEIEFFVTNDLNQIF